MESSDATHLGLGLINMAGRGGGGEIRTKLCGERADTQAVCWHLKCWAGVSQLQENLSSRMQRMLRTKKYNYIEKIQQWKAFLLHTKAFRGGNNRRGKYLKQIVHESNYINVEDCWFSDKSSFHKEGGKNSQNHFSSLATTKKKIGRKMWQVQTNTELHTELTANRDCLQRIVITEAPSDIMTFLIWSIETNELQASALFWHNRENEYSFRNTWIHTSYWAIFHCLLSHGKSQSGPIIMYDINNLPALGPHHTDGLK